MKKAVIPFLSLLALIVSTVCRAQEASAQPKAGFQGASPDQPQIEEVIVSVRGLYGDWKMVLPEWPGFDKPLAGDFCNFKKRDEGVAIICADDFLQEIPEVALDGHKLRMRWGGALNHTIYDAVRDENGTFKGEIIQAQMGIIIHRFKANMERVSGPAMEAPQESLRALTKYFVERADPHARFVVKYYGKILEQKGGVQSFPDIFKVLNGAEHWCLVRAEGPANVRCRDIP
ncbi:MAG TPA: hypothetical protein VHW69_00540 [Rhizomicrobium sp.]|jgi:hypothetical protein|nr:hypothetical protein [Rhizomicrobium sp.]